MGFSNEVTLFGVVEYNHVSGRHELVATQTRAQAIFCTEDPTSGSSLDWSTVAINGITAPPELFVAAGVSGAVGAVGLQVPASSFDADPFVTNQTITVTIGVPGTASANHDLTVHLRALPSLELLELAGGGLAPTGAGASPLDLHASGDPASPASGPLPAWTAIHWDTPTAGVSVTPGPATSTTVTGPAGPFELQLWESAAPTMNVGALFDGSAMYPLPGASGKTVLCGAAQPTIVSDGAGPSVEIVGLDSEVGVSPAGPKTIDFQLNVVETGFVSLADTTVTFVWAARDGAAVANTVYEWSGGVWQLQGGSAVPPGVAINFPAPTIAATDRSPIDPGSWGGAYPDAASFVRRAVWGDGTAAGNVQVELTDGRFATFDLVVETGDQAGNTTTDSTTIWISIPTSIVVCLDYSGSMSSPPEGGGAAPPSVESKWDAARDAANRLHAVFHGIAPAIGGGDPLDHKVGYVRFWWNDTTATDATTAAVPLQLLSAGPAPGTLVADGDPPWLQFTPTGSGVLTSASELADAAEWRRRVVVLMTDGHHNRGVSLTDIRNAPGGAAAFVPTLADDAQTGIIVHTCGFGTDAHVDSSEIETFAGNGTSSTGPGKTFGGQYHSTATAATADAARELTSQFIDMLLDAFDNSVVNKLPSTDVIGGSLLVDAGVERAVLMITTDAGSPSLFRDGTSVTATTEGSAAGVHWWVLDAPTAGNYSVAFASPPPAATVDLHGVVDLRLRAQFAVEGPSEVGATLTLRCRLTDDGRPVSGADVWAEITSPGRSDGELVARFADVAGLRARGLRLSARAAPRDAFRHRRLLVEAAEKHFGLDRDHHHHRPGIRLHELPDRPGHYEASFSDTSVEGTYRFELFAEGEMVDGSPFERAYGVSRYLEPVPSPELTGVSWIAKDRLWKVVIEPRSTTGFALGGGHTLALQVERLKKVVELRDRLDGTYEAILERTGTRPPRIALRFNGRTVKLAPRRSALPTRHVRVILERIRITDLDRTFLDAEQRLVFESAVVPGLHPDQGVQRRIPERGGIPIEEGRDLKVDRVLFDGHLVEGVPLLLTLGASGVDCAQDEESRDARLTYRRVLEGPLASWAGEHGPDASECGEGGWDAWFRVDVL